LLSFLSGGAKDVFITSRRKYARNFVGCLRDFYIESRKVSFDKDEVEEGANINPC